MKSYFFNKCDKRAQSFESYHSQYRFYFILALTRTRCSRKYHWALARPQLPSEAHSEKGKWRHKRCRKSAEGFSLVLASIFEDSWKAIADGERGGGVGKHQMPSKDHWYWPIMLRKSPWHPTHKLPERERSMGRQNSEWAALRCFPLFFFAFARPLPETPILILCSTTKKK